MKHLSGYLFSIGGTIILFILWFWPKLIFKGAPVAKFMDEICANAIDDDNDGLIDLNDPDCACEPVQPTSLIPNPSFEDRTCCPIQWSQLNCASEWIQASEATTDYVHDCGYQGHHQVPNPIPDGQGCIGFRDGRPNQPAFKEYTGACLTSSIEANVEYRLEFFAGFANQFISPATTFSVFGTTSCSNLPFGTGNENFGCPSNDPDWFLIGDIPVSGGFGWERVGLSFMLDTGIDAIVIGPDCALHQSTSDRYYFMDDLRLALTVEFGLQISPISGHPCTDDLVLSLPESDSLSYQWYKEGIALLGETSANYAVPPGLVGEGLYQVRIDDGSNCQVTIPYLVEITEYAESLNVHICDGESYQLGNTLLTETGVYTDNLLTAEGCDSMVQIDLVVEQTSYINISEIICTGSVYELGNELYSTSGVYTANLLSTFGCDSIVQIALEVLPPTGEVNLKPTYTLSLGEQVLVDPGISASELQSFIWRNTETQLSTESLILDFQAIASQWLYFEGIDLNNCPIIDSTFLNVEKNYKVYIPNAFSPNDDGRNDRFTLYGNASVEEISHFQVFDRWGGLVFEQQEIPIGEESYGWDGKIKGQKGSNGVYAYVAQVLFVDGFSRQFKGDVVLVK